MLVAKKCRMEFCPWACLLFRNVWWQRYTLRGWFRVGATFKGPLQRVADYCKGMMERLVFCCEAAEADGAVIGKR